MEDKDSVPCNIIEKDPEKTIKRVKEKRLGNVQGLLHIKVPKAGSSTLAGINLRMARNHLPADSYNRSAFCAATFNHFRAWDLSVKQRSLTESYLWTFVRDSTKRIVSHFFFRVVTRMEIEPTYNNFIKYLNGQYSNFDTSQISFVSTRKLQMRELSNRSNMKKVVQEIIDDCDFIGIHERFDESLVVLRFLLGLSAGDIMYLSSKVNGGCDDGAVKRKCYKIKPSFIEPKMKTYFDSNEWKEKNAVINMIYEAANRSLERTIDQVIGRPNFDKAFIEDMYLKSLVHKICFSKAIFPCSQTGERQIEKSKKNATEVIMVVVIPA